MVVTRQPFPTSFAPDGAFVLAGELDLATIQELQDVVNQVIAPGRALVFDLAQLRYIDTSAMRWFVDIRDETGHPVILRNVSPLVRRILDVVASVDADGDAWVYAD